MVAVQKTEVAAMPSSIVKKRTLYIHDDWIQDWDYVMAYFSKLNINNNSVIKLLVQEAANELRKVEIPEPGEVTVREVFEMMGRFFEEGK
jgi:hypothetical protein